MEDVWMIAFQAPDKPFVMVTQFDGVSDDELLQLCNDYTVISYTIKTLPKKYFPLLKQAWEKKYHYDTDMAIKGSWYNMYKMDKKENKSIAKSSLRKRTRVSQ